MAKKVLIVEDDASIVKLIEAAVKTIPVQSTFSSAPSGEEAMLAVILDRPDLLIIDLGLPGMSGWDLIQLVRKRNSKMAVLIITGHRDESVLRRSKEMGLDGCFFKPLVMKVFLKKVKELLLAEPIEEEEPEELASTRADAALAAIVETGSKPETLSITSLVQNLHQELKAISVVVLGENGHVVMQAGEEMSQFLRPGWESSVLTALSANAGVLKMLPEAQENQIQYFKTENHVLLLTPTTRGGMVVLLPDDSGGASLEQQMSVVLDAQNQLAAFEEPPEVAEPTAVEHLIPEDEPEVSTGELETRIDVNALFAEDAVLDDADSFWDEASEIAEAESGAGQSGFLNFEQAQQLGLVPDEDTEST